MTVLGFLSQPQLAEEVIKELQQIQPFDLKRSMVAGGAVASILMSKYWNIPLKEFPINDIDIYVRSVADIPSVAQLVSYNKSNSEEIGTFIRTNEGAGMAYVDIPSAILAHKAQLAKIIQVYREGLIDYILVGSINFKEILYYFDINSVQVGIFPCDTYILTGKDYVHSYDETTGLHSISSKGYVLCFSDAFVKFLQNKTLRIVNIYNGLRSSYRIVKKYREIPGVFLDKEEFPYKLIDILKAREYPLRLAKRYQRMNNRNSEDSKEPAFYIENSTYYKRFLRGNEFKLRKNTFEKYVIVRNVIDYVATLETGYDEENEFYWTLRPKEEFNFSPFGKFIHELSLELMNIIYDIPNIVGLSYLQVEYQKVIIFLRNYYDIYKMAYSTLQDYYKSKAWMKKFEQTEGLLKAVTVFRPWLLRKNINENFVKRILEVIDGHFSEYIILFTIKNITLEDIYNLVMEIRRLSKTFGDLVHGAAGNIFSKHYEELTTKPIKDITELFKKELEEYAKREKRKLIDPIDLSDFEFKDNVHELFTPLALRIEGNKMHHCVGGYSGAVESGRSRIFHIETEYGPSTAEIRPGTWYLVQHRAISNKDPHKFNKEIVQKLVEYLIEKYPPEENEKDRTAPLERRLEWNQIPF